MGFFFRKGFRFGALRLNLSKRGVGVSAGVKGAHVGVRADGEPYVAAGRDGLYYRQNIGRRRAGSAFGWLLLLVIAGALVAWLAG